MNAQQLLDHHRMVLIESDTYLGHEILCTALAKKSALVSIEFAMLGASLQRFKKLVELRKNLERL